MRLDRQWILSLVSGIVLVAAASGKAMISAPSRVAAIAIGMVVMVASVASAIVGTLAVSWRTWNGELSRMLKGPGSARPEVLPVSHALRDYVDRIVSDREFEALLGGWTPARLKSVLIRLYRGERVITIANREPYIHQRGDAGQIELLHPASGLVTALEPVMRACSGLWIAHGSGSADRDTADASGRLAVPPDAPAYTLQRIWLSAEEERGYYAGFANEGLWPLCHIADTRPVFRKSDWETYREVNARFARAAVDGADRDDPVILVQDYHFALVPRLIRQELPRATIITFWHIPWPNAERVGICPYTRSLLEGLLGSSIIGFQTAQHCNAFLESVDRQLEARLDRDQNVVVSGGRSTLVRSYPISIAWPDSSAPAQARFGAPRGQFLSDLALPPDGRIGFGVDRLDYTKGIEERLLAVERLLERHPEWVGRFAFVQIAAPSRTGIANYQLLSQRVAALVERINTRFGAGQWTPISYRHVHYDGRELEQFYRAADVCYVSSLHDGMNLVAKEFVAARDDERGVLVLSKFTGAARELHDALIVNPYDVEEAADAIHGALTMSETEQQERMRALRGNVARNNVYRWAARMLMDASTLREHSRRNERRFPAKLSNGSPL